MLLTFRFIPFIILLDNLLYLNNYPTIAISHNPPVVHLYRELINSNFITGKERRRDRERKISISQRESRCVHNLISTRVRFGGEYFPQLCTIRPTAFDSMHSAQPIGHSLTRRNELYVVGCSMSPYPFLNLIKFLRRSR
jgi:hypothetical protein